MDTIIRSRIHDSYVTFLVVQNEDGSWQCDRPATSYGFLLPEEAVYAIINACKEDIEMCKGRDRQAINEQWIQEQADEEERQRIARRAEARENKGKKTKSMGLECFVYLVKDIPRGLYKIGKAVNVQSRMNQLKTANASIELVAWYKGVSSDERALHSIFEERRVSGEWFSLEDDQIEFIKNYFDQKRA